MKKNIKWIIIFVIIAIIIEGCVFAYNTIIDKLYSKYKFIDNEPITLNIDNVKFESEDENYESLNLDISKDIKIYNVKLVFKEKFDGNLYVRIRTDYGDKFLPKANYPTTEFKTYYKEGINTNNLKFIFPKDSNISIEDIANVIINSNLDYMPYINFSIARCICYFIILILIYFFIKYRTLIYNKINNAKIENLFLLFIVIFGIIYTFVNVPLIRYDEHAHFWRSYELSLGKIKSDPMNKFPKSVIDLFMRDDGTYPNREFNYDTVKNKFQIDLNAGETISFPVGTTGGSSIVAYLATTLGTFIARIINLTPMAIFYVGRIFNLAMYAVLVYYAIKICPSKKFKKIIGIVSLFPMSLNLAASFSYDVGINGFTLLAISYFLKLKFDENIKEINLKHIVLFSIFAIIPTICKVVYIFLFGFMFFIPKEKFKNKKMRIIYILLQIVMIVCLYVLFNSILKGNAQQPIEKNPIEQIIYCVSNPIRVFNTFIYTLSTYSSTYLFEMIGGWNTPSILSIMLAFVLFIVAMENEEDSKKCIFNKFEKTVLLIISILEFLSVFVALYIDWSTAQASYIMGIQGRYFIPVLPIFLLAINNDVFKIKIRNKRIKYVALVFVIYIVSIIYSVCTYM